jgi:acyl-coenzyme A synthetase/AMP-(fatty) acid ligase
LRDITTAIRRAVTEGHGIVLAGVSLLAIGTMPKTSSGKLRRHACRLAFVEQSLDEMMRWTPRSADRQSLSAAVLEESAA